MDGCIDSFVFIIIIFISILRACVLLYNFVIDYGPSIDPFCDLLIQADYRVRKRLSGYINVC